MPPVIPYIPQRITVHLGPPNADAEWDALSVHPPLPDFAETLLRPKCFPKFILLRKTQKNMAKK